MLSTCGKASTCGVHNCYIIITFFLPLVINITTPSFGGDSYITFGPIRNASINLTISLYIRPTRNDGLILFNSFTNLDFSEYVYLVLADGYVEFGYDNGVGSEPVVIRSNSQLQLDEWHYIEVTKFGHNGLLVVNDNAPVYGYSSGPLMPLRLGGNLWIGGTDGMVDISSVTGISVNFQGCLDQLTINGEVVELVLDAEMGYGVGVCNFTLCLPNPCMNGGDCEDVGTNFFCNCTFPFTGALCGTSTINPCEDPLLCAAGATCLVGVNGLDYTCLCPVGATGERCDQSKQFVIVK